MIIDGSQGGMILVSSPGGDSSFITRGDKGDKGDTGTPGSAIINDFEVTNTARLVCKTTAGGTGTEAGPNTWTKIATVAATNYTVYTVLLAFVTDNTVSGESAIVQATVRSNGASAPTLMISMMAKGGPVAEHIADDSFKLIAGSPGGNNSFTAELWVRKVSAYGAFAVYELAKTANGGVATLTYHSNAGWQSAIPSGAVNATTNGVTAAGKRVVTHDAATFPSSLVTLTGAQTLTNKTLTSPTVNTPRIDSIKDTNGAGALVLTATGSAVNYTELRNNVTGGPNQIRSAGADSNIDMMLVPKGSGGLQLYANTTSPFQVSVDSANANQGINFVTKGTAQVTANGNPVGVKVAVPATATSTGVPGQWAADASHYYVCTATNTWRRAALSTW